MDDPTLALMARFVGSPADSQLSGAAFLLRQVHEIERYVERFPAEDREARALQWIEANAARYREKWQKQAAVDTLANSRCPDCPLSQDDPVGTCAIHRRWLALLRLYAASELSSRDYVEQSLALLAAHKDQLKVHRCREASPATAAS